MKQITTGIAVTLAFMLGMYILTKAKPRYPESTLYHCRVNKVVEEFPHGGITPDVRYRLTTDEGFVVFSYNREFSVGDSIEVRVVRISKQ